MSKPSSWSPSPLQSVSTNANEGGGRSVVFG